MASVTSNHRYKRRLLEGMVEENLETVSNKPRGTLRRERLARAARLRRVLRAILGAVSVALVATAMLWAARNRSEAPLALAEAVSVSAVAPEAIATDGDRPVVLPKQAKLPGIIPVTVRRIAVDPGHGGRDGGTSLTYGLLEKDLTLDIGRRLAGLLEHAGLEAVMTRDEDLAVSLRERAEIANAARADLFISIHINWLPDRTARGIETYYLGATDDPFLKRLAATENRDSGFALADYRELLEGLYAGVRADESRRLAASLQASLAGTLREDNPEIVARGVMRAPFAVLVATEMPAVLAEVACLSNDREARLLSRTSYRQRIAEALLHGIVGYAEPIAASGATTEKGT